MALTLIGSTPGTAAGFTNFGTLLNEWRAAVNAESRSSGKSPLLLTAAVFYSSDYYSLIYPIQAISNSLDWLNIMAYDFYSPDSYSSPTKTGPPAALYNPTSKVSGVRRSQSLDSVRRGSQETSPRDFPFLWPWMASGRC